jgi:hypothetical protein
MALDTNFNVNPYNDDFEETKKYLRLLFKPGFAVQARELTQIQSLVQNQIERFGNHIFQNGSVVTGGQFFLQDATYLKLDTAFNGVDIDVNNFDEDSIVEIDSKSCSCKASSRPHGRFSFAVEKLICHFQSALQGAFFNF